MAVTSVLDLSTGHFLLTQSIMANIRRSVYGSTAPASFEKLFSVP